MDFVFTKRGNIHHNLIHRDAPDEWARLHDVLVECGMGSVTEEQARQVFFELPEGIKYIAFKWGIGDTVFGDEVYTHLTTLENK